MRGRQLGGLTLARAVEMVMPFDRQGVLSRDHAGRMGTL